LVEVTGGFALIAAAHLILAPAPGSVNRIDHHHNI
jgi:hypothetical protein